MRGAAEVRVSEPPGEPLVVLLRAHAARTPDAFCLAHGRERLTFRELDQRSNRIANALLEEGLAPLDRVAIIARTAPIFYELAYGCAKAGVMMLPLNWRLSSREIASILADAEPALILASDEFAPLLPDVGTARPHISVERAYEVWRDDAAPHDPDRPIAPDDPTLLLYTSGTTGQPKGVMISHRNLSYVGRTAGEAWGFTEASVNLVAMPLFHIGGIGYGMMALSQGGGTVLLGQPDPGAVLQEIQAHGVTHTFFVPSVLQRFVEHVEECGALPLRLARIIYGAAPIGEPLLRRALALFNCDFSHAYGMTETAGTVVTLGPEDHDPDGPHKARLRACGKPLPWVELAIVDPATAEPTPVNSVGEIRVRSGMTMLGYWRKPEETAAVLTSDGWLCTGDAASRDADGYIYIQDRYKDMIVSGGENIYPTEVENVLQSHAAVAEVAVIGVPHDRWGETPRAYVVLRAGATPTSEELVEHTRLHLARYKCPTSVRFIAALPKTASGKITKAELRKLDMTLEGQNG
jgi:acyl-CoA synthetase (AMP-forming)/AMP-acid ligase II